MKTLNIIFVLISGLSLYNCAEKNVKQLLPATISVMENDVKKSIYNFKFDEQNRLIQIDQNNDAWQTTIIEYDSSNFVNNYIIRRDSTLLSYTSSRESSRYFLYSDSISNVLDINEKLQLRKSKKIIENEKFYNESTYKYRSKKRLTQRDDFVMDTSFKGPLGQISQITTYYRYDNRRRRAFDCSTTPQWVIEYFDLSFWAYNPVMVNNRGILRSALNRKEHSEIITYVDNEDGYPRLVTVNDDGKYTTYEIEYIEAEQ